MYPRSDTELRTRPYFAVMGFDNGPRNDQSEPQAVLLGRIEGLENAVELLGMNQEEKMIEVIMSSPRVPPNVKAFVKTFRDRFSSPQPKE